MNEFNKACVVGAGTMGHGIAFVLAQTGMDVCLIDQNPLALEVGLSHIDRLLESSVQKQKMTSFEAENISSCISE